MPSLLAHDLCHGRSSSRAPSSDRIPVELFQILKDDAVESAALNMQYAICNMHSICNMPAHGSRGIWPRDVLKKVSRGRSRVEAGSAGVGRLVQVAAGGFSWWL